MLTSEELLTLRRWVEGSQWHDDDAGWLKDQMLKLLDHIRELDDENKRLRRELDEIAAILKRGEMRIARDEPGCRLPPGLKVCEWRRIYELAKRANDSNRHGTGGNVEEK